MLLKTNLEKMSVLPSLAMLLKKHGLYLVSRDVDENKAVNHDVGMGALRCDKSMIPQKIAMMDRRDVHELRKGE